MFILFLLIKKILTAYLLFLIKLPQCCIKYARLRVFTDPTLFSLMRTESKNP